MFDRHVAGAAVGAIGVGEIGQRGIEDAAVGEGGGGVAFGFGDDALAGIFGGTGAGRGGIGAGSLRTADRQLLPQDEAGADIVVAGAVEDVIQRAVDPCRQARQAIGAGGARLEPRRVEPRRGGGDGGGGPAHRLDDLEAGGL